MRTLIKQLLVEAMKERNLTLTIIQVRKKFIREYGYKNIQEINKGGCEDFAQEIKQLFPACALLDDGIFWANPYVINSVPGAFGEKWDVDALKTYGYPPFSLDKLKDFEMAGHTWVYYEGKHYDAETIWGVENFWNLPIFKRQIKKEGLVS